MLLEEGVCYDQCIFLAKLYSSLPCFIPYSKAKFSCYSRCFLISYFWFQSPIMKRISFLGVSSKRPWAAATAYRAQLGEATPRRRSGAVAKSARLRQRRSTREELPHVPGQGWQLGGATRRPRPGVVTKMSNPKSKEQWLHGHRRA